MKRRAAPGRYLSLPDSARAARACEGSGGWQPSGEAIHMIGENVMVPSSETDQLRQQLLQAQKLSSVGALASSVAHEFNNILTTIINYARMAQRPEQTEDA